MSENLYCEGNKITNSSHIDGWYRTFKGYPEMNEGMWGMISEFSPIQLLLFFAEYATEDQEYAGFLTREVLDGTWKN